MLKKIVLVPLALVIIIVTLSNIGEKTVFAYKNIAVRKPIQAAVFLINFTDDYISLVRQNLEDIQRENPEKVEFTFYDGQSNQAIQSEQIDNVLRKGTDLILLQLINNKDKIVIETLMNQIKERNVPTIFFNREPTETNIIKSYAKALYIGIDAKEDGIKQGQILADAWNKDRNSIDRNQDDIMQYIMFGGEPGNIVADERTKYSVSTIEKAGIKTMELASAYAYWTRELAKNVMQSLFLQYGNKIEVIISNDDSMALGIIDALQSYGYNKGNKDKTIAVVGVEGLPETQELIKKGMMLGTVFQDPKALAQALYTVGINLVQDKEPLEDTPYSFDQTGIAIRIPNQIIIKS